MSPFRPGTLRPGTLRAETLFPADVVVLALAGANGVNVRHDWA